MTNPQTEWRKTRLGDFVEVISGYAFKSKDFQDEGIPVIKIRNIRDGYVDMSDAQCIDPKFLSLNEKYHVKGGDLLISLTGSHLTQPGSVVGRVAIHAQSLGHCLLNQRAGKIIVTRPAQCDTGYLFYALSNGEIRRTIALIASGAASQANISPRQVKSVEMLLPPPPTQRKIAAILSTYDDLIENNTRRIAILEEMAQAIYREWFVHFHFPGHEGVRMVESELGLVPEGWEVVNLGDIAQEVRRSIKPDQVDPETRYVGLEHIPRKSIALTDWGNVDQIKSTKLIFNQGEILFGKIRPYFHKVVVAPFNGICSTDTIVILPKKAAHYYLVLGCVSSEHFVDYATQTSQGTKMPRADWKVLVKYPIALAPPVILTRFNEIMQDIVAQIHNMIFRNQNLRQTRDLLLPRLISGELDVSGLEVEMGELAG